MSDAEQLVQYLRRDLADALARINRLHDRLRDTLERAITAETALEQSEQRARTYRALLRGIIHD